MVLRAQNWHRDKLETTWHQEQRHVKQGGSSGMQTEFSSYQLQSKLKAALRLQSQYVLIFVINCLGYNI